MKAFPNLKIAQKLPLAVLGAALVAAAAVGIGSYIISSGTVAGLTEERLRLVAEERSRELTTTLEAIKGDLLIAASASSTIGALGDLQMAWKQFAKDPTATLQDAYITRNPNPPDQREKLEVAEGSTGYNSGHKKYHGAFAAQRQVHGYGDIYLFDKLGNLIYSVTKQTDFAQNFADGSTLGDTDLGRAFRAALAMDAGQVAFTDLSAYAPIGGQLTSFIATPVFSGKTRLGVIACRMPQAVIGSVLDSRLGLGETGETFLVGEDGLFRSDSRFSDGNDMLATSYRVPVVVSALRDATTSTAEVDSYRNMPMLAVATPLGFEGARWALVATVSRDEAMAPVTGMGNMILVVGAVVLAAAALLGLIFARSITGRISRLNGTMEQMAAGDFAAEVRGVTDADELGTMARSVEVFRNNGLRMAEMGAEQQAGSERRRTERTEMMQGLQSAFGKVVNAAIDGEFDQRVTTEFPDPELNKLAQAINTLVETVDRGIGETASVLSSLANTDLTRRMTGEFRGAFGRLRDDTNQVADRLADVVGQLRETSSALRTATGEILSGANDLSERTTKQAATIEETSAAIEQLAATVMRNADRAREASEVAGLVTRTAEEGGSVMHQANDAMGRIEQSSAKISNIIGLIDDIAFQTNLLALNASVEAARAGEAGKGFAVVAIEVRRLAQSAAQASNEVKALIEQSGNEVKAGSRLVADASQRLSAMVESARSSNQLMEQIARESRTQASAIDEVNTAVRQLDEMTQHNAALVEQTNAAIEQTEGQARDLDRIVEVFHVGNDARTDAPARSAAAKPAFAKPATAKPATAKPAPARLATAKPAAANAATATPAPRGIKALQQKAKAAAASYLGRGNAAIDSEWSEF